MHKRICLLALIMIILFNCPKTYSQESDLTLEELSSNSSDIIIAKVISKISFKNSFYNRIYTEVKLQVTNSIKGKAKNGEMIKLVRYGGTYGGLTTVVVGHPSFSNDEEILLFLEKKGDNYGIVGSSQGKYNISPDKNMNEKKIIREQIPIPLLERKNGQNINITDSQSVKLNYFLQMLKKYN